MCETSHDSEALERKEEDFLIMASGKAPLIEALLDMNHIDK